MTGFPIGILVNRLKLDELVPIVASTAESFTSPLWRMVCTQENAVRISLESATAHFVRP
jgi:hypothetical protein